MRRLFAMLSCSLLLAACGGGSGGSTPTPVQTQAQVDATKLATLKKVEGNWTFSYTVGIPLSDKLTLSNVSKLSINSAPNLDYEVTVSPSAPNNIKLGAYSSIEDVWVISGSSFAGASSLSGFSGGFEFKTDGNVVLPGGCFYRTDKSTGVKSACYPLTGIKTSSTPPNTTTTKTATLSFNISSINQPSTPINAIDLSAYLPAGVTTATTVSATGLLAINNTDLVIGNNMPVPPDTSITGVYTPNINKVRLMVATGLNTFSGGEFARLTVSYPSTITLTANDFSVPNTPLFPSLQVIGSVTPTSPSIDLTNQTRTTLSVVFN